MRLALIVGLVLTLAACGAVRLAYQAAPTLAYHWIDGFVDLREAQSVQVREELEALSQWHRREELPAIATMLRDWRRQGLGDLDAAAVCREFERVRERLDALTERSLAPLARLALQLDEAQFARLAREQARSLQRFERDFLRGDPDARLQRRLSTTVSRLERVYGRLDESQRALLADWLARSPFDPARTLSERRRQQEDLRQTLRALQEAQGGPWAADAGPLPEAAVAAGVQALRAHLGRLRQSPTPGHDAYTQAMLQHGCAQMAALHNRTRPFQRAHAARVLQDHEGDALTLAVAR